VIPRSWQPGGPIPLASDNPEVGSTRSRSSTTTAQASSGGRSRGSARATHTGRPVARARRTSSRQYGEGMLVSVATRSSALDLDLAIAAVIASAQSVPVTIVPPTSHFERQRLTTLVVAVEAAAVNRSAFGLRSTAANSGITRFAWRLSG
jgi:hypothetical protein